MIQSKLLLNHKHLIHIFADNSDFSSNMSYQQLINKSIIMNQVHSCRVVRVHHRNNFVYNADGMVTRKNLFLGIKTADCIPVFLYEYKRKIVGALHAGWQGLYLNILKNACKKIINNGGNLKFLHVALGPHIHDCCYSVPFERIKLFHALQLPGVSFTKKNANWYLNLGHIAYALLKQIGIKEANIDLISHCTCCNTNFHSFRREGKKGSKMINIIGIDQSDR